MVEDAPAADHTVSAAAASPARQSSGRVDLPLSGIRAMTVSLAAAPADQAASSPAAVGASPVPTEPGADAASPTATVPAAGGASPAATAPPDDGDGPTATALSGDYAAYVTAVDPANGSVTFDVVEWFTGTAAQQACTEDGNPGPWPAEQCNDYYVRDKNVVSRTLPVAPRANLRYVDENGPAAGVSLEDPSGGDVPATLSALAGKLAQLGPDGRLKAFIKVGSGALTSIEEIFTP
ncbi:hypothetical protein [Pseudofrankia sp. DC12]|uniref:hypothetical protein n=1 Tax=Pseudofrankia sp. DC12 TaxID=683315 RepID=UPI001E4EC341|nr:hypothetical protein [Pseudofrankia sp. DC12]